MENLDVLVLGNGFLGSTFGDVGYEVWGRDKINISNTPNTLKPLEDRLREKQTTVINCIGKTKTQWCENKENSEEIVFVNGVLPGLISDLCAKHESKFVHISTGCVYDISDIPQKESDPITGHCEYVKSKMLGELNCNLANDIVIRPRLFYGDTYPNGYANLIKKMSRCFTSVTRDLNSVTSVHTIVSAVTALIQADVSGVFNVADRGYLSMYEINKLFGTNLPIKSIEEIRDELNIYLVNCTMDTTKLEQFYEPPEASVELLRCFNILYPKGITK